MFYCHQYLHFEGHAEAHRIAERTCHLCGEEFQFKKDLDLHLNQEHDGAVRQPCSCYECKRFRDVGLRFSAFGVENNNKTLSDEVGSEDSVPLATSARSAKRRRAKKKKKKSTESQDVSETRHNCSLCGRSFRYLGALSRHKLDVHGETRPHSCSLCDSKFEELTELVRHMRRKHSNAERESSGSKSVRLKPSGLRKSGGLKSNGKKLPFKCLHCKQVFTQLRNLVRHVGREHEGKRFPCGVCDFSARSQDHLNKHFEKSHVSPEIFCEICGFGCSSKKSLTIHRRMKHPVLECAQCDFTCHEQIVMTSHQQIHEESRESSTGGSGRTEGGREELLCPFRACTHSFGSTRELDHHQRRHLANGAVDVGFLPKDANECRFCGQIVSSGSNTLRHENRRCPLNPDLTSEEEKLLQGKLEKTPEGRCVRCGKMFFNQDSHSRHEQICEDMSICSLCKRKFATYAQMRRHKKFLCPKQKSHRHEGD